MTDDDKTTTTPDPSSAKATEDKPSKAPASKEKAAAPSSDKKDERGGRRDRRGGGRKGGRRREREPKEFEEAVLQIDRVTRVVKGGRRMRFRISIVIGDKKGRVGFGLGKSGEVLVGIQKSVAKAKRELINVPIVNDTIPHEVNATFKASRVLLFPAPEGKGVIAGGAVRKILELAGIKNVLSKVHGSRNRMNIAFATFKALQMLSKETPYKTKKEKQAEAEAAPADAEALADKPASEVKTDKPAVESGASKDKAPAKKPAAKKPAKKSDVKKSEK